MKTTDRKAAQVDDVVFVFAECARVNKLILETPPAQFKDLPRDDILGSMPHPSGDGDMPCSVYADRRVWSLAEQALQQSDAVGTLETQRVYQALQNTLVDRFARKGQPIDTQNVDRALAAAVRHAKRARSDQVHYVPCRLMYAGDPDTIEMGPVTFVTLPKFNEMIGPHFDAYVASDGDSERHGLRKALEDARHYYDDFTWVAQVKVLNCDDATSRTRADIAVTAALNFLHAFFGAYHTRHMDVGGPRLDRDQRARLVLGATNKLVVSRSSSATSAVGFTGGWGAMLEGERMAIRRRGAAKALEPLVDAAVQRPLGTRLVDAAAWFGDAVREPAPAAQVIKAVTGLETLVVTGEHEDITSLLSARAAAVVYHPMEEKAFEAFESELRHPYAMRSGLTHGSISPFDPEVSDYAGVCFRLSEQVITAGLELFESHGFIDNPRTPRELGKAFDQLVLWAKAHSTSRAEPAGSAP
jgi:hypothetical protein